MMMVFKLLSLGEMYYISMGDWTMLSRKFTFPGGKPYSNFLQTRHKIMLEAMANTEKLCRAVRGMLAQRGQSSCPRQE